eukprot:8894427-Pyramimonas_sp.AAC.1
MQSARMSRCVCVCASPRLVVMIRQSSPTGSPVIRAQSGVPPGVCSRSTGAPSRSCLSTLVFPCTSTPQHVW